MKKYLAAITLLLAGCMVSYWAGRQSREKDYEAACILSDICRYALDSECLDKPGFEDIYYGVLGELEMYNTQVTREEIEHNYCYAY